MKNSPSPDLVRTNLQERKREFAREAIWSAAIELFVAKGFDQTTVDEIAAAAGTSRRSFFRHFESKSDLMALPVESYGAALAQAIDACPSAFSPSEVFHEVVLRIAQEAIQHPDFRKVMDVAAQSRHAREPLLSRVEEAHGQVAEALARRFQDPFTTQVMAGLTFSLLSITFQAWLWQPDQDISIIVERVFAVLSQTLHPAIPQASAKRRRP